jgi:hypothetical protein
MIILAMIALVVALFILLMVVWILGMVGPPIYEQVMGREAVQALGMDTGLDLAMQLGLVVVPVGLGLSVIIWYHVFGLKQDVRYR